MIHIPVKPMTVNQAWQGRRFKTDQYKAYERLVMELLPDKDILPGPYALRLVFYVSSKTADIDNPVKPFLDILQAKYGFNDRDIFLLIVRKRIVRKGDEGIDFEITKYNEPTPEG